LRLRQGEEAASLTQSLAGLTEREREEGEGLTGEGEDDGASRIGLGRGEEGSGRGWCEEEGARGELFIGARGRGERWSSLTPASFPVPPLMAHSAAEGTLRRGGTGEDAGQGEEDGAVPNFPVRRGDGGEATAGKGRRGVVCGEDDEAADRWGRSASGSERAREGGWQVGLACRRERGSAERAGARAEAGREWAERGGAWAREGGESRVWAESRPSRAGRWFFLFLFTFQTPFPFFF
jgi:hypothetical protein